MTKTTQHRSPKGPTRWALSGTWNPAYSSHAVSSAVITLMFVVLVLLSAADSRLSSAFRLIAAARDKVSIQTMLINCTKCRVFLLNGNVEMARNVRSTLSCPWHICSFQSPWKLWAQWMTQHMSSFKCWVAKYLTCPATTEKSHCFFRDCQS